jgi:hypothetical protein
MTGEAMAWADEHDKIDGSTGLSALGEVRRLDAPPEALTGVPGAFSVRMAAPQRPVA